MATSWLPPTSWLDVIQLVSLSLLALASLISCFCVIRTSYPPFHPGEVRLEGDELAPLTIREEFRSKLLDCIGDFSGGEGDFVEEQRFWHKAIPQHFVVLISVLSTSAVQGIRLYGIYDREATWIEGAVIISTHTYQLLLAAYYARTKVVTTHRSLTYHLFNLSAVSLLYTYLITVGRHLARNSNVTLAGTDYTLFFLSLLQTLIIGSIPCEPMRHTDLKGVYVTAVSKAIQEQERKAAIGNEHNVNQQEAGLPTNVVPEYSASILSRLSWQWVSPLLRQLSKVDEVDIQDLPGLHHFLRAQDTARDSIAHNGCKISAGRWGTTRALLWEIWAPRRKVILAAIAIALLLVPLGYIPHIALQQVLATLEDGNNKERALAWAMFLVVSKLACEVARCIRGNFIMSYFVPRIGTHARYLIYSKLLTRNSFATAETGPLADAPLSKADILNLNSVDVNACSELIQTCIHIISNQLDLWLGGIYVWVLLGTSRLWGLSTLLLTSVPAYFITKLEYRIFEKRLAISDQKTSLMQEAIQAISMIKMMAAEKFWFDRIKDVRDREFAKLAQARMLGFVAGLLYSVSPTAIIIVSFAHYTLIARQPLTATIAFTSIAVFDQLRPALQAMPGNIAQALQELLSAKRIGHFLATPDIDYMQETATENSETSHDQPLYIRGSITWSGETAAGDIETEALTTLGFKLESLNVHFHHRQMTLIAGKFGSDKTLMLLALLGEARLLHGSISYAKSDILQPAKQVGGDWDLLQGGVAYVPQTAWLQSLSIRENILFGLPLDMERYRTVIHAVGLLPDLEILEDADLTEIGERGKILSGGQKARVSLARAVYSGAATLLLDDVISAVDAQTTQHIIRHCFNGPLMAGRTVIIASHAAEALAPIADHAIFLQDGRVKWEGSDALPTTDDYQNERTETACEQRESISGTESKPFELKEAPLKTPRKLVMEEKRSKGRINMSHWRDLVNDNGGLVYYIGMTVLLIATCLAPVVERRVLELWTRLGNDQDEHGVVFWVSLYAGVSCATASVWTAFGVYRFVGALRASKKVHSDMLAAVLHSKMLFFSRTRAGSIIQRFGTDLNNIMQCSEDLGTLAETTLSVLFALIAVIYYGGRVFIGIVLAIGVLTYQPIRRYRVAALRIRRLDLVMSGPINAIYGETVAGTAVIRAFGAQSIMVNGLLQTLNMRLNTWSWRMYLARWLTINMALLDTAILSGILFIVLTANGVSAASAGFILAFGATISTNAQWFLIQLRNLELDAVGLERTSEYRNLEQERGTKPVIRDNDARETSTTSEYATWPSEGRLQVETLSTRYGPDMPEILHHISFSVEGGQRVGIVGATGGGKSTLAKALFNFVDVTHGRILIDGQDIAHIPLGEVRSKLGIIAQDPILLSGTLRLNLDIEGNYSDAQLYDALHQVRLGDRRGKLAAADENQRSNHAYQSTISSPNLSISSSGTVVAANCSSEATNVFNDLDFEIKSGGENLSAGQKQLVVLARALLKKHKILILDEATASIDSATDTEISRVIHEQFEGATVLIIAHRLRTIMPYSKILVMDNGNLIQQDSPADLIRQEGKFQELCMAAGNEEYHHLVTLAEAETSKACLIAP